nr:MAG TPA: hypothetical protein [Crassvirales sp.]
MGIKFPLDIVPILMEMTFIILHCATGCDN